MLQRIGDDIMSDEENKAVIRQFAEGGLNQHSFDQIEGLLAPNYTNYFPGAPGPLNTAEFKKTLDDLFTGFPDIRLELHEMIAEGDAVAARYSMYGTHTGTFLGIPATGKRISIGGTAFYHVKDGKMVDDYPGFDALSLMQQIGVVPTPEPAGV
jgi:steroid delta-isomerase-like uncharacterized protein